MVAVGTRSLSDNVAPSWGSLVPQILGLRMMMVEKGRCSEVDLEVHTLFFLPAALPWTWSMFQVWWILFAKWGQRLWLPINPPVKGCLLSYFSCPRFISSGFRKRWVLISFIPYLPSFATALDSDPFSQQFQQKVDSSWSQSVGWTHTSCPVSFMMTSDN